MNEVHFTDIIKVQFKSKVRYAKLLGERYQTRRLLEMLSTRFIRMGVAIIKKKKIEPILEWVKNTLSKHTLWYDWK